MILKNKRAISPLVATILLIAFAVSIGALIMNWSSSATTPSEILKSASCPSINLIVDNACTSGEKTSLSLINKDSIDISSIILRTTQNGITLDYLIDSKIANSETKSINISKTTFNQTTFKIIPVIKSNNDNLVCSSKASSTITLTNC